ncbi:MAG: D-alanyl-D-alanine carboxypeptidase, partial [Spirochaetae bacterium HGW-Spirochaetae-6]
MKKFLFKYLIILSLLPLAPLWALNPSLEELQLDAPSAMLLDQSTGEILYEKNADQIIAPASLTKLMSLHVVYEKIKQGIFTKDTQVPIRNSAWALRLPRRTSRMFLEPGQKVSVFELMQGLAIPSGNDAAVALAEFVSGSVEQFTQLMNEEAKKLGFSHLYFEDASGLSEKNTITAREFAFFCHKYLELHPESIQELHMHQEFTYPLSKNLPDTHRRNARPIKQRNRNSLLRQVPGVDGLKTGYIDESGFNIAFTADREGTRLVGVILGVRGKTLRQG